MTLPPPADFSALVKGCDCELPMLPKAVCRRIGWCISRARSQSRPEWILISQGYLEATAFLYAVPYFCLREAYFFFTAVEVGKAGLGQLAMLFLHWELLSGFPNAVPQVLDQLKPLSDR